MSHEVSDTVESPLGGFWNVYGTKKRKGLPLPLSWPFEMQTYPTADMGDAAAAARSNLFGRLMGAMREQPPQAAQMGFPLPWAGPQPTPYDMRHAREHVGPANAIGLMKRMLGE